MYVFNTFHPPLFFSDPVGPAHLELQLDQVQTQYESQSVVQSGSPGLRVSWSRSAGHVDWYDVILENTSSGTTLRTRIMDSAIPQSGFSSLIPGTLYNVSVVASAGNKSAPPVHRMASTGEIHMDTPSGRPTNCLKPDTRHL